MRALGDIVDGLKIFQSGFVEFEALLETTKGQPLMLLIKSIGPCQKSTGSKGPAIDVIEPI